MANPFVHIELNTDDVEQAKQFYRSVFQWKLSDMSMGPGMSYTMLDVGKGVGGGMQKKQMPNAPTAWLPYVEVASVRDTVAKAGAAGAQVVLDYMEIPGTGAIGIFVDPAGAALGVWETEAKKKAPAKKKVVAKKAPAKKKAPPKKKGAKKRR